jgi:DNA-binding NtrC family response regulator
MPGMNGMELFQSLQSTHPELAARFIFMTGGLATRLTGDVHGVSNRLFEKPFDLDQIRSTLRGVVVERRAQS